jgi:alpha-galactosidase
MKKLITAIFTVFLFGCFHPANGQNKQSLPGSNADVQQWVKQHFAKGKMPPFSFIYGGKSSNDFIKNWQFKTQKLAAKEPNSEEIQFTWTDKKSGLVVKCNVTVFNDFQAVEWVLKFSNTSKSNTPQIEKVAVVDQAFNAGTKGSFVLHHAKGSDAARGDFQPIDEIMVVGKNVYMTPAGGRSSDKTAFPFFNIEMPGGQGIMVAVGWTGKWYADVVQTNENSVTLNSGMEKINLKLLPGEEIRTPKISLLFWKGDDRMVGHNQFRQFILAHHSRKVNGKFAEYPLSGSFDYGDPAPCGEYECLTEEYAIALVKRYQQFNTLPELFWLDAGWYKGCNGLVKGGQWHLNVGNWTVEKERFPNGLRPVSDAVHKTGAKFMVWFELERVRPETQIDREHPEWLIKLPNNKNYLFNLGNKEALQWMTNYITDFIKKEGIDYYRQDFNFDPKPYWDASDAPDRIGISEIKHIEGLYAFWDSLLVRFPKLLIDNCASGGRRLDLETTSRSAPLWRTDYQYGEPNGYQCHTFGLNLYLPIHGTAIYKTDGYTFRSGLGGTAVMNWEVTGRNSESIPAIQKRIKDYKDLRPYFYADYYPLTESLNNQTDSVWLAYQLNRPEQNDGIIIAFRRNDCPTESITVRMGGLDATADYELVDDDSGKKTIQKGEELIKGITLSLTEKPGSLLIRYKKK